MKQSTEKSRKMMSESQKKVDLKETKKTKKNNNFIFLLKI